MTPEGPTTIATSELELIGGGGVVRHSSEEVHCAAKDQRAVISVVSRSGPREPIRFVLWCSLRAIGECDERCLRGCGNR